jgi:2-polyprenyl-6-methoxyphenol hydroxylase-like FAD-dependent oxidoreductase
MILGLLLARAGVKVLVLEKHADFLRDFRGDTVHPSTLQIMYELGLLDRLLELPHSRIEELSVRFGDSDVTVASFKNLPIRCRFVAIMPQWEFLNFIAREAERYPSFRLLMNTEATDLIEREGAIAGVAARGPDGPLEILARLVVGANGRQSGFPERAGLETEERGVPMDVFWFRLSRRLADDPPQAGGRFDRGRILVLIPRVGYWQVGYVIPKGSAERIRAAGLEALRDMIARAAPFARDRVQEIQTWDDVKLLTVRINRLRRWFRPGLLFIGDAAHAMSPVGGVGINLAIQDAVATANAVAVPLREGRLTTSDLERVQRRRELPMRVTQKLQMMMQEAVIRPTLRAENTVGRMPIAFQLLRALPPLRRVPAYLMGMGLRQEHVRTPAIPAHGGIIQTFEKPTDYETTA